MSELVEVKSLCVSASSTEATKTLRASLLPLLEGLVPVSEENCALKENTLFIYNDHDKLGAVAVLNPERTKARLIFSEKGTSLEVVAKLVAQIRKLRKERRPL